MSAAVQSSADVVVVGAGVVGIAVARLSASRGYSTVLLESADSFGQGVSSRNSAVIHAGLYYPTESMKAQLCVRGRELIYEYCEERRVPHKEIGKYVVASSASETDSLEHLFWNAKDNGCHEVKLFSRQDVEVKKGQLEAVGILHSPRTGIVDSPQLMLSMLGDFENAGGVCAWRSHVHAMEEDAQGVTLQVANGYIFKANKVVNAAGLGALDLIEQSVGQDFSHAYARGDYYLYSGSVPFDKLVYPLPVPGGLGVHLTFDMGGGVRFGPDVTWVESPEAKVDLGKEGAFAEAIRKYWPSIDVTKLRPGYAGIRPKIKEKGSLLPDFKIVKGANGNVITLLGIESPGLTCCMALAELIIDEL